MDKEDFIKKLEKLSKQKGLEQTIEYKKAIRCLNPEHEDKNPSMIVYPDKAICKSCGYTIPNSDKAKPYKAKIPELIIKEAIEKSAENFPKDFVEERKYDKEIIKKLRIGYFNLDVYNHLINEWGMDNLFKAGLVFGKNKRCPFINRVIIPITEFHFTIKPSDVSIKGSKKTPYIIDGSEPLIICEGECDAIALHHIYPKNKIMALCGCQSQTPLKDITEKEVWICFDNDDAGEKAEYKATQILKGKKIKKIVFDRQFKDIDLVWRKWLEVSINQIKIEGYKPKDILLDKDYEPIIKEEYRKVIVKNFPDLWWVVDLCLSIICINKLREWTDPVNVNLVGPPSSEKTTAASFFYNIEGLTYKSDDFTPKAFVSHAVTVTKEELNKIDLLPRIKDMCFITPELGPIFSKRKEDLAEMIGILTRVFDGEGLQTDSGSQGRRGYEGEYLFTMLGATTPLSKTVWNLMGKMGSRMFFCHVPDIDPSEDMLNSIIHNEKSYGKKLKECKDVSRRMIFSIFNDGQKRNVDWDVEKNEENATKIIVNCARLLCNLRGAIQVWEDDYKDEVLYESPLIEKPMRIVNIFQNIAKGHAISEGRNYITLEDVWMIPMITTSTMPEDRLTALKVFLEDYEQVLDIEEIADKMRVSKKVARKTMKTLEVLRIIEDSELNNISHKKGFILNEQSRKYIKNILSVFPNSASVKGDSVFYIPSLDQKKNYVKYKNEINTDIGLTLGEKGKSLKEKVLDLVPSNKEVQIQDVVFMFTEIGVETQHIDNILENAKKQGEIIESKPGFIKKL